MLTAHFTRYFAAAHRVWNDDSKCSNIHGHNYDVEVVVGVDALTPQGFVTPFEAVKDAIDLYDHTLIVDGADPLYEALEALGVALTVTDGPPSTEHLAGWLARDIAACALAANPNATHTEVTVNLRETPGIEARAFASVRLPVT